MFSSLPLHVISEKSSYLILPRPEPFEIDFFILVPIFECRSTFSLLVCRNTLYIMIYACLMINAITSTNMSKLNDVKVELNLLGNIKIIDSLLNVLSLNIENTFSCVSFVMKPLLNLLSYYAFRFRVLFNYWKLCTLCNIKRQQNKFAFKIYSVNLISNFLV